MNFILFNKFIGYTRKINFFKYFDAPEDIFLIVNKQLKTGVSFI